jgi:ankyrin repeat protein
LVERGANPLLTDKNKERPLHYAKRNGHMLVAEYLSSCKNDMKKVKEVK